MPKTYVFVVLRIEANYSSKDDLDTVYTYLDIFINAYLFYPFGPSIFWWTYFKTLDSVNMCKRNLKNDTDTKPYKLIHDCHATYDATNSSQPRQVIFFKME